MRSAAVGVWVDVGTRHEPAPLNGVAHLLEHMVFKGTTTRSAKEIACAIEAVGGSLNAWTSREHTAFHARVLAEDVPLAVELISDILTNPLFDERELVKECEVVVQEIGQVEDTPDDLVFDLFQEQAYPDQPLGRSILGTVDTIRAMRREALVEFMATHYAPERMVLAAAGAIDHAQLVELAQRWFQDRKPRLAPAFEPARYVGGAKATAATSNKCISVWVLKASLIEILITGPYRFSRLPWAVACLPASSKKCVRPRPLLRDRGLLFILF